jgi:hypothetical protein
MNFFLCLSVNGLKSVAMDLLGPFLFSGCISAVHSLVIDNNNLFCWNDDITLFITFHVNEL